MDPYLKFRKPFQPQGRNGAYATMYKVEFLVPHKLRVLLQHPERVFTSTSLSSSSNKSDGEKLY